jgi:hypothetical protein
MSATLFGIPEGIALLTGEEQAVWASYQRFLHCIPLASEGPLGTDAIAITAALLTLATSTAYPPPP